MRSAYFFIGFIFYSCIVQGQTKCTITDINIKRQSQLDSFPIKYGHCDCISNHFNIYYPGITSLDSLYFLTEIESVNIDRTYIKNVNGLRNVRRAGRISLSENGLLEDISGLKNLKIVGLLYIGKSGKIKNLQHLALDSISVLGLSKNQGLTDLSGLKIGYVNQLSLKDNTNMTSLQGAEIAQVFEISIGGDQTLRDISDYQPSWLRIHDSYTITHIRDINGLTNLQKVGMYALPNLHNCAEPVICRNIHRDGFLYFWYAMGQGCSTVEEVKAACLVNTTGSHTEDLLPHVGPNPFFDYLTITLPETISFPVIVDMYNVHGKSIYGCTGCKNEKRHEINTRDWPSGIYFYSITDAANKIFQGKLIKVH